MQEDTYAQDKELLKQQILKLFDDLSWTEDKTPNWEGFRSAFRADAILYPSARPAEQVALNTFIERMETQRTNGNLKSIVEKTIAFDITVFGNTALAYTSYTAEINGGEPGQGANAFLLVKNDGKWEVGAMAWDNQSQDAPLPETLRAKQ